MMRFDEIEQLAADFAQSLNGHLGPRPIEKVVRDHLALFTELRRDGASWRQIAAFMVKNGVKNNEGGIVRPEHWAAMVSRAGRNREGGRQTPTTNATFSPKYHQPPCKAYESLPLPDKNTAPIPPSERLNSEINRNSIRARMRLAKSARDSNEG